MGDLGTHFDFSVIQRQLRSLLPYFLSGDQFHVPSFVCPSDWGSLIEGSRKPVKLLLQTACCWLHVHQLILTCYKQYLNYHGKVVSLPCYWSASEQKRSKGEKKKNQVSSTFSCQKSTRIVKEGPQSFLSGLERVMSCHVEWLRD